MSILRKNTNICLSLSARTCGHEIYDVVGLVDDNGNPIPSKKIKEADT